MEIAKIAENRQKKKKQSALFKREQLFSIFEGEDASLTVASLSYHRNAFIVFLSLPRLEPLVKSNLTFDSAVVP